MMYEVKVLKEKSLDPFFMVQFLYPCEGEIRIGIAKIVRQAPKPLITYDEESISQINGAYKEKLELELLNAVIDYIFMNGVVKSWRGNVILRPA